MSFQPLKGSECIKLLFISLAWNFFSLLWHVRRAVGFFIEIAREGHGGLNAESAFKPAHCTSLPLALCMFVCVLFFRGTDLLPPEDSVA